MSQYTVQSILFYFSQLFVLCKFLGIYPYNLQIFQQYGELKKSTIGTICVVLSMVVVIILYNLLILSFSEQDDTLKTSQSTLTFVIGIFLTYIGLVMMATDQLSAIRNQKSLGQLYDRIRIVDERLLREGCLVDNTTLRKRISIMIVLVFICELTIMISSYIVLVDHTKWKSLLWIFSCFPTLYNSLDKIWFAVTLHALQQRFFAINKALNDMVEEHERYKILSTTNNNAGNKKENQIRQFLRDVQEENLNYLYAELSGAAASDIVKYKMGKNRIIPVAAVATSFNNFNQLSAKKNSQTKIMYESQLSNVIKVEEKLNNLCQLHDELCEIGKMLNELWSYPILVLMAYGFLIFTAQLYFLYCATQGQDIPTLFLSARNAFITALFLFYTAGKCIYLIFLSWKTSLESKSTGIYMHKCGVVADNNELYEIINHLSLKLLNHTVDFTACGFFSLNMETLYGISGGITSYLIILIQFNLAAQQAKEAMNSYSSNRTSDMDSEEEPDTTTSLTSLISSTITTALTTEI
ncbi:gustatory receptor for bitter taste 66a [Calliphora vicina]|uniref:gustatory receptor for bitter taste 66a n=1 Tax=Calliphora vicina TaxID=7373 RepID=UPI00325BC66B